MTNLDKWKAQLTVDDYFNSFEGCYACPIENICEAVDKDSCMKVFIKWANSEVNNAD